MIAQLRANPASISAIALIAGFALIVSGFKPWGIVAGAALTLLAFLVPFIRLSFVQGSTADTLEQGGARIEAQESSSVARVQSAVSDELASPYFSARESQLVEREGDLLLAFHLGRRTTGHAYTDALLSIRRLEALLRQGIKKDESEGVQSLRVYVRSLQTFAQQALAQQADPEPVASILAGLDRLEDYGNRGPH